MQSHRCSLSAALQSHITASPLLYFYNPSNKSQLNFLITGNIWCFVFHELQLPGLFAPQYLVISIAVNFYHASFQRNVHIFPRYTVFCLPTTWLWNWCYNRAELIMSDFFSWILFSFSIPTKTLATMFVSSSQLIN